MKEKPILFSISPQVLYLHHLLVLFFIALRMETYSCRFSALLLRPQEVWISSMIGPALTLYVVDHLGTSLFSQGYFLE